MTKDFKRINLTHEKALFNGEIKLLAGIISKYDRINWSNFSSSDELSKEIHEYISIFEQQLVKLGYKSAEEIEKLSNELEEMLIKADQKSKNNKENEGKDTRKNIWSFLREHSAFFGGVHDALSWLNQGLDLLIENPTENVARAYRCFFNSSNWLHRKGQLLTYEFGQDQSDRARERHKETNKVKLYAIELYTQQRKSRPNDTLRSIATRILHKVTEYTDEKTTHNFTDDTQAHSTVYRWIRAHENKKKAKP